VEDPQKQAEAGLHSPLVFLGGGTRTEKERVEREIEFASL
jgi:hypothetical protein